MATMVPFRALRYDPARVVVGDVVTQPYDKITPEMQERYYAASAFNLVRIILGKAGAADGDTRNVYSRAAQSFAEWRRAGIFLQDREPSIYAYAQRFTVPGRQEELERTGFIALGRIEEYSAGVVFRHEQTLSRPKADRLELLRATRAHFGQIFMLYSDPKRDLDLLLSGGGHPEIEVRDEYDVLHRVSRISDMRKIELVKAGMRNKKLIIADGHHRYETALAYRNERREHAGERAADGGAEAAPYDFVMMTFVNMDSEGLVILPTHRIVHGLPQFDAQDFLQRCNEHFEVEQVFGALDGKRATSLLGEIGSDRTVILAALREGSFLLRARPQSSDRLLERFSARQQKLDVVCLHTIVLEHVLGISEEAIRSQQNVRYLRDPDEALASIRAGAQIAFLMNPARMEDVREIAFAGEVLPQKSTDFYPKLLSGLTVYALE
jgi:uncharacterized protein (DUF1015 family)